MEDDKHITPPSWEAVFSSLVKYNNTKNTKDDALSE